MRDIWWKLKGNLERNIRWIACFFVGHDVWRGNRMDNLPANCRRCWYTDEERNIHDGVTMPCLLNHTYCWLVERDWHWFEALDEWLIRHATWLPAWWEY